MRDKLTRLTIKNFRSLANLTIDLNDINVLFGSNGSGKSTFLDTIWFIRDCAINGVESASSSRSHGIGACWDGADEGANISVTVETQQVQYEVLLGYSGGRIEPYVGEKLMLKTPDNLCLIDRKMGSEQAKFCLSAANSHEFLTVTLKEPEKLAFSRYIDFKDSMEPANDLDRLLHFVHFYHARSTNLYRLKTRGSDSGYQTMLWDRGENLWSVLNNLNHKIKVDADKRYDKIIELMRESFPGFDDIILEQTGPTTIYGSFLDKRLRQPIFASGVSDGHLQMLLHLTALFSEGKNRDSLILFDEPEISLHPWAIAVFAKAVKLAAETWNKQIFIATHSPVLMSQFAPEHILETSVDETGQTVIRRLNEISEIQDLLKDYAVGSLYMAELIAPQSKPS